MECFLFPTHPSVEGPVQSVCAGEERRKKVIRRAICLSGSWGQLRFFCRQIEALRRSKGCMLVWLSLCIADWSKKNKKNKQTWKTCFPPFSTDSICSCDYFNVKMPPVLIQFHTALISFAAALLRFGSIILFFFFFFYSSSTSVVFQSSCFAPPASLSLKETSQLRENSNSPASTLIISGSSQQCSHFGRGKWCVFFYFPWFLKQALTR